MKIDGHYEFEIVPPCDGNPHWTVQLPHQCDEWEIVGWAALGYPDEPTSAADSVARMEVFVAEARLALETLRVLALAEPEGKAT